MNNDDIADYPDIRDDNRRRIARELIARNDDEGAKAEYYNDWIMENLG